MSSQALPAHSKRLFRYLFEHASLGIAVEDLDGRLLLANPALCLMLGYREKELCGMRCSEFGNPEDSRDDRALFQQLRAGLIDEYSMEKRYLRKDGAQRWGRLNVSLLKDGNEGPGPLVFAFVEDITEYKQYTGGPSGKRAAAPFGGAGRKNVCIRLGPANRCNIAIRGVQGYSQLDG